jgi:hypothetical protein
MIGNFNLKLQEITSARPTTRCHSRGALLRDPHHDWRIRLRLSTKARKTLFIRVR